MIEGWHGEDYLVLFDGPGEAVQATNGYGIAVYIPSLAIVGLKSWDDFIVKDLNDQLFTLPTVPLANRYLHSFATKIDRASIRPDDRFKNRIKWYVKPLVFGGSASLEENRAWLNLAQHQEAVKWWNQKYRELQKPV